MTQRVYIITLLAAFLIAVMGCTAATGVYVGTALGNVFATGLDQSLLDALFKHQPFVEKTTAFLEVLAEYWTICFVAAVITGTLITIDQNIVAGEEQT
ncbi:hypothetical protein C8A00DRAFT_30082 [Chaetomidium leptoderma]|uniref:Uncharacterized protein n=1 Tax=Chaetomidium leptoderma TaxID=669021 RepID=A0AAN6VST5_9PEZI|nr:hypothetical protein C8A00DRAFT_30082 [Chaetomidium leptoderma]